MDEPSPITHEEWYYIAKTTANLLTDNYGSVGFPGRLIVRKTAPSDRFLVGYSEHGGNIVRVLGYDVYIKGFWYSLQDAVECLTSDRFDDDAPRFAMLDYLEDRGYIS